MMKLRDYLYSAFLCLLVVYAPQLHAVEIVSDNFIADGTGSTDAAYFGSSSSSAIEFNPNSIGLVSATSGRTIHALFETQTLSAIGEKLVVSLSFTTPATVATTDEELRIGLFDHLGRIGTDQLGQNTNFKKSAPNPLYDGLPGFYSAIDIERSDPTTDLDIRRAKPPTSGTFLADSKNFERIEVLTNGSSSDSGYAISPNTSYTVNFVIERIFGINDVNPGDELMITSELYQGETLLSAHTEIDINPLSFSFGMLGVNAGSNAVGSTTQRPNRDNGIDITSFKVSFEEDEFANW